MKWNPNDHPKGKPGSGNGGKFIRKDSYRQNTGYDEIIKNEKKNAEKRVNGLNREEYFNRCKTSLIHRKTSDGKEIKRVSPHAFERGFEREIYPDKIVEVFTKGKVEVGNKANTLSYGYKGVFGIYNYINSEIITVMYKGKGKEK